MMVPGRSDLMGVREARAAEPPTTLRQLSQTNDEPLSQPLDSPPHVLQYISLHREHLLLLHQPPIMERVLVQPAHLADILLRDLKDCRRRLSCVCRVVECVSSCVWC